MLIFEPEEVTSYGLLHSMNQPTEKSWQLTPCSKFLFCTGNKEWHQPTVILFSDLLPCFDKKFITVEDIYLLKCFFLIPGSETCLMLRTRLKCDILRESGMPSSTSIKAVESQRHVLVCDYISVMSTVLFTCVLCWLNIALVRLEKNSTVWVVQHHRNLCLKLQMLFFNNRLQPLLLIIILRLWQVVVILLLMFVVRLWRVAVRLQLFCHGAEWFGNVGIATVACVPQVRWYHSSIFWCNCLCWIWFVIFLY